MNERKYSVRWCYRGAAKMRGFWQSLKGRLTGWPEDQDYGKEKGAAFYDDTFKSVAEYNEHYTESEYYFLWTVIIERIRRLPVSSILEIGCGPGQLASAIHEALPSLKYCGFDFSPVAVNLARSQSDLRFEVQDALTTDLVRSDYDLALSTEFLEHVDADIQVLESLKPVWFIGTVPNFPYESHVRHFTSVSAVVERYSPLFNQLEVIAYPANSKGKTFYLMQGMLK